MNASDRIPENQQGLSIVWRKYLGPEEQPATRPTTPSSTSEVQVSDAELRQRLERSPKFTRLDRGDWRTDYKSQSEADLAYCGLVWKFGGDESQADRFMRQSGLYRPDKWDKRSDYRERTLRKATSGVREPYIGPGAELDYGWVDAEPEPATCDVQGHAENRETASSNGCPTCKRLAMQNRLLKTEIKALHNKHLKQAAPTIVEVVKEIDRLRALGKADDEGWVYIPYKRIGERLGLGKNTIGRHLKQGQEAGVIEKITERQFKPKVDHETGELGEELIYLTYFRPAKSDGLAEQLEAVARYELPEDQQRNWGGKRVHCPKHPNATVTRLTVWRCDECGQVLDEKATKIQPGEPDEADDWGDGDDE